MFGNCFTGIFVLLCFRDSYVQRDCEFFCMLYVMFVRSHEGTKILNSQKKIFD